jgi:hypothetical protein
MGTGALSLGVKRLAHEVDHSPAASSYLDSKTVNLWFKRNKQRVNVGK